MRDLGESVRGGIASAVAGRDNHVKASDAATGWYPVPIPLSPAARPLGRIRGGDSEFVTPVKSRHPDRKRMQSAYNSNEHIAVPLAVATRARGGHRTSQEEG